MILILNPFLKSVRDKEETLDFRGRIILNVRKLGSDSLVKIGKRSE